MKTMRVIPQVVLMVLIQISVWGQVTINSPVSSSNVSSLITIDFNLSTAATAGTLKLTFTDTESGTSTDGSDPHIFTLETIHETSGNHSFTFDASDFSNNVTNVASYTGGAALVDGAIYDVKIEYSDGTAYDATKTGITYDITVPTLMSASRSSDTELIVALSEDCNGLANGNDGGFTVNETGASTTIYAVSGTAQGADASHVVLTVASMAASGMEGVTVTYTAGGNGTVNDLAGNALANDITGVAVSAWEETPPTITSGTVATDNTYIDILFSEGVYGTNDGATALTADKLALTFTRNGGNATNATILSVKQNDNADEALATALAGGETTVRVFLSITGTPSGVETVEMNPADGSSIYDAAGNAMLAAQTTGVKTLHDLLAPSVISIVRKDAAEELTNAASVDITVSFNEPVTGVTTANFSVDGTASGASVSSVTKVGAGVYETTWTVSVTTGGTDGTVRLDLSSNLTSITDEVGNELSTTYTTGEFYTVDKSAPSPPTINGISDGRFNTNQSFTLSGIEAGATAEYSLDNGSSWNTYSAAVSLETAEETETTYQVIARQTDAAGNASSESAVITLTIDKINPTVVITSDDGEFTTSNPFPITITFSEEITGFLEEDITVNNGQVTASSLSTTDNIVFTATIDPAGEGTVDISLASMVCKDLAGNDNEVSNTLLVEYATSTNYSLDVVSIESNNANNTLAKAGDVITLVFTSPRILNPSEVSVTIAGHLASLSLSSPYKSGSATYTMHQDDMDGVVPFSIEHQDKFGNVGTTATTTTDASSVLFDDIPPTTPTVLGDTPINDDTPTWTWTAGGGGNGMFRYKLNESKLEVDATETTNLFYTPSSPLAETSHTLYVQERDEAGNWSASGSYAIEVDITAPATPTIDGIVEGTYNTNQSFTLSGIESGANAQYSLDGGSSWSAYTGAVTLETALGTETSYQVAARQTDEAGNLSSEASIINITIDKITETPTLTLPATNDHINASISLEFTLPEAAQPGTVKLTFIRESAPDRWVVFNSTYETQGTHTTTINGEDLASSPGVVSQGGNNYLFDTGVYKFKLEYQDFLGNPVAISENTNIGYSTSEPQGSFTAISPDPINTAVGSVTLNFSKYVNGDAVTYNDFTLTRNGSDIPLASGLSISHTPEYTYNYIDYSNLFSIDLTDYVDTDGDYVLTLVAAGSGIKDWYGNDLEDNATLTWTMDKTPPTISPVSINSNNANPSLAVEGDVISLNFEANETITSVAVTIGGVAADIYNITGNRWLAEITLPSGFAVSGEVPFEISCADLASNPNTANATTNGSKVIFDNDKPSITSINLTAGTYSVGNHLDVALAFDEIVEVSGTPFIVDTLDSDIHNAMYISGSGSDELVFRYTIATGDMDYDGVNFSDRIYLNSGSIVDLAGNDANLLFTPPSPSGILVDGVAPTASSIKRYQPLEQLTNQNYVDFRVIFSESVTGVSEDDFSLFTSGSVQGTVESITPSGASIYVVRVSSISGSGSLRLDLRDSNTGIKDTPGNAISTGFTSGEIYNIDITGPLVELSDNHPDAIVKNGDEINITATFSENVNTPKITIGGLVLSQDMSGADNVWTYSWAVPVDNNGLVGVSISTTDIAGNANAAATGKTSYTVDNTQPTVELTDNHPDAIVRSGDVLTLTATFTEANGIDEGVMPTITIGGLVANAEMTMVSNLIWRYVWTVPAGEDKNGDVEVSITASDVAGNASAVATGKTSYTVDNTQPTVVLTDNQPDGIVKGDETVTITATFSENVNTPKITIGGLVLSQDMSGAGAVWAYAWTVPADHNGTVSVSVSATDMSGNTNTAATGKTSYTVDNTQPTVVLSDNHADAIAKNGDEITITATFSENVNTPKITIGGLVLSQDMSGADNVWTYSWTVPVDHNGLVGVSISTTDIAGNDNVAATGKTSYTIDNTEPTVVLSDNHADAIVKSGDVVTLTATFTEANGIDEGSKPTITIGGLVTNAEMTMVSNLIWRYVWTVPAGEDKNGDVEVSITASDVAGNANTAATGKTSYTVDNTQPTVVLTDDHPDAVVKGGETVTITATFSETVNTPQITIGGLVLLQDMSGAGAVWTYTWAVPADFNGAVTVSISSTDMAGNSNTAATGKTSYTVDNMQPTVVLSDNHPDAIVKNGDVVLITATFNENVNTPQITIGGLVLSQDMSGADNVWTYSWAVPVDNNGLVGVSISTTDIAGNDNAAATGKTSYTIDNTLPTLTAVSISSNYLNPDKAKAGTIVTVNFTSSEQIQNVSATILGNAATITNIAGDMWKATYEVTGSETVLGVDKVVDFSVDFEDIAGNTTSASNADITNGSSVTLDITPPNLTSISIYSDHSNTDNARVGSLITLEFNATESIENVTATINTKNTSVEFDSGSNTWFAYYYMKSTDTEGELSFTIDYQDMAGNSGAQKQVITTGSNVTFDKVKPTFSSVTIYSDNSVSTAHAADGNTVFIELTTSENVETPDVTINGISATSITGGPTSWIASRVLSSGENEGVVPFTINAIDLAGNEAQTSFSTTDASSVTFDDSSPGISTVTVSSGVYKVGDIITVFIQADNNNYVGQTVEVNGKNQELINNNNNTYTVKYTIAEGDNDVFQLGSLPINVVFKDLAGNTSARTEAIAQGGTITVDANTPVVQSVMSTAEDVGNLIIDNQIVFTVTPETPEEGLAVQPAVYNLKPLVWSTTDGGVTYTATYTVAEGDDSQETPLQLGEVTLTDAAGNASASVAYGAIQKSIFATKPTATILGTTTKCDYGQMVPIRFEFTGYAPYQLTYNNGTDDVGPVEVAEDYYEFEAESGTFTLVNLTDAKGNYSSSALQNAIVTVNPLPEITLNILGSPFNVNDPRVNLTGFATPSGGTFSGDGVSANGYFYPSMIELNGDAKTVPLTYTYSDANGCENSASQDVVVSSGGAVIEGVLSTYCQYNESFSVVGKNPNNIIGWFNMPTSTTGWTDNGDNTLTISPQQLIAGEHTIEYFYIDGETTFDTERTFVIDSVGANIDFGPLQISYCADDDVVNIQAQNLYPSGGTGNFSGPANGFGTQPGSNQATFEPSLVDEFDKIYEISYFYQSPRGCVSKTITKQVQVNSLPVLSFDIRDNYNYNEPPVTLQGNFADGVFSATGGIVVDNILYPDRKEPGDINITYFYNDPTTGCSNTLTKPSRIREAAEVIEGLSEIYCYANDTITISSEVTDDASIVGVFTSEKGGLVSTNGNTARYSLAKAGSGEDRVTFSYYVGDTPYEVTTTVLIDSIGPVTITGLAEHFCADDQPVEIRGYLENAPQGTRSLTYSGTPSAFNSSGNVATLSPTIENPGNYEVGFTFTSVASGCSRDTTYSFEIHSLPDVSTDIPDYYNIDAENLGLVGLPAGGVFSANRGVSGNEFYPEVAGAGSHDILYTYTDEFGCVNSVSHSIVVIGADGEIAMPTFTCIDSEPVTITASTNNGLVGQFVGNGITNTGDETASFNPSVAGKGIHTISYKYLFADDGQTELMLTSTIEVDSLGVVEIFGLQDMYCFNDPSVQVTAAPAGGAFTSTEYLLLDKFYPSLASTSDANPVSYTYINTRTGCSITGSKDISVRPVPEVAFGVEQSCSDLLTEPVQFINKTVSEDQVDSWLWSFDSQGFATSDQENPSYLYLTSGSKLVTLKASTEYGCQAQRDSIVNVGLVPKANFTWLNECQNGRETSLLSTTVSSNIVDYRWEFPDGTTLQGEDMQTIGRVFTNVDVYDVKLVITSQENCKDSIVKPVRILPVVKFNATTGEFYSEDFEDDDGHWLSRSLVEGSDFSWSFGLPSGDIISSAASGNNAWFTQIDMDNQIVENSQVVSPCFDFTGLERPMLKMGVWSSPVAGRNGAVVQYSTDDGITWETLGEENSGINWYNSSSIQSQPGGQITGWSSDVMDSWAVARHSLDELAGHTNVRFRVAFASDGLAIDYFDGFAFDDIWIGNREQNLLVEYFTNSLLSTTVQPTDAMVLLESNNESDVVPIHYHTDYPSGDPMFELYSSGISARQLYYGVTGIPYALTNGTKEFDFSNFGDNQTRIVNIERLKDPSMSISVTGQAGNSLNLSVLVKALKEFDNRELVLQCAVVQKEIDLAQEVNGQSRFYNVVRQFVPDAGGTPLQPTWSEGDEANVSLSWQIPATLNKDLLNVAVFVQDLQTREVYQVALVNLSDIVGDNRPEHDISIALYPNPATSTIRLVSPYAIEQLSVVDASGRTLMQKSALGNQVDVSVDRLKPGLYIVNVKCSAGVKSLRFVKK